MRARVRHEWLQKHATPSSASGDFHWHPARVDADLRAEIAERARGCAAWARLAPGRVVWARGFDEIAPADGRRYAGLVVTVIDEPQRVAGGGGPAGAAGAAGGLPRGNDAERGASAAALLAAVPAIEARPWHGDDDGELAVDASEPEAFAAGGAEAFSAAEAGAAAAALRTGEPMACAAIGPATARALATLDTWNAREDRGRERDVAIRIGAATEAPPLDHYAGQAWRAADAIAARRVWRAALALAVHEGIGVAALFDELAALAAAWDRADELDAWLARTGVIDDAARAAAAARGVALAGDDAGWLWNRVVHAWGRGCFAPVVADRIAGALARRILADHLIALERAASPMRYWRRLRWEALLPRERRADLEGGVRARIPSLIAEGARG